MRSEGQKGYPQPDDPLSYLALTYDLTDYCRECGVGGSQIAPFRLKGELKLSNRNILQLNWVYDEYFVTPEVWEEVFRPHGVGRIPVLKHRSDTELKSVVQLDNRQLATSPLAGIEKYPSDYCQHCKRKKYHPIKRGAIPEYKTNPSSSLSRTQEYFGTGHAGWNVVTVSNALYKSIVDYRLKGVRFVPLLEPQNLAKSKTRKGEAVLVE